jgi:1,4-dihydroxy-2-naphthoate octaprenyltransferase
MSGSEAIKLFIRMSRPLFLLGAVLLYALGVGIARYLGNEINWSVYLLGQTWVTLLQLATHYLNEYYDAPADADNPNRTPFSGGSGAVGPDKLPLSVPLISAAACLAIAASITVMLINTRTLTVQSILVMGLIFAGAFFYSAPPVRLASSGYGELTSSIIVANLVPAFAFLLQVGVLHRLIAMATFPLTTMHIAMMLAFELPDFATDVRYGKTTLLVRMGWQSGMTLHNMLILFSYLLLGLAMLLGMPTPIALPAFLTFPLGVLQIWQMHRISEGSKPYWQTLTLTSMILFGVTAYLLAFGFWTR